MKLKYLLFTLTSLSFVTAANSDITQPPLLPQKPIALEGKAARFDFMAVDKTQHRLLAAHKGAGTLEILNLETRKQLKAVPVGEVQGVSVDENGRRYFLGLEKDHAIVIIDAKTFKKEGQISVEGPVDAIAFDKTNGLVYAAEDDGHRVWVVNPEKKDVSATIDIPGVPEVLEFSPETNAVYLNIKDKNEVVRIDPTTNKVNATWSTLPVTSPHGLVVDDKRGHIYTAGSNGHLAALDMKTGKLVADTDISPGVDQVAFDQERNILVSACKGLISITRVTDSGFQTLGSVVSPQGAHTIAIDPQQHNAWVSFADKDESYLQEFQAPK